MKYTKAVLMEGKLRDVIFCVGVVPGGYGLFYKYQRGAEEVSIRTLKNVTYRTAGIAQRRLDAFAKSGKWRPVEE